MDAGFALATRPSFENGARMSRWGASRLPALFVVTRKCPHVPQGGTDLSLSVSFCLSLSLSPSLSPLSLSLSLSLSHSAELDSSLPQIASQLSVICTAESRGLGLRFMRLPFSKRRWCGPRALSRLFPSRHGLFPCRLSRSRFDRACIGTLVCGTRASTTNASLPEKRCVCVCVCARARVCKFV